ncbi:MAG: Gfo/Idh/MocA family oxidoreductase [Bryobacteraceae bacterium]
MRDMSDHDIARRAFLRGVTTTTALSYSRVMGANDRVQLALIGCGERGRSDLSNFVKLGVYVVALSDIWDDQLDKAKQIGPTARTFRDYRHVLDLKEVDAALIAVPDHWHAPIGLDALHAGKDVYIEKPLTLKPEEGPAIVKAARVNNRICQVGMQQRSGKHYLEAKREYLDSGGLGKVTLARTCGTATDTICAKRRHGSRPSPRISIGQPTWDASSGAIGTRSSIGTGALISISAAAR